jgi:hypothetical protein
MRPNDAALRRALIDVLDAFEVGDYEDINVNGTPMIAFQLRDKTYRFSYSSATEDTNWTVRRLANILSQAGLTPTDPTKPPKDVALVKRKPEPEPVKSAEPIVEPVEPEPVMEPIEPEPVKSADEPVITPSPEGLLVYAPTPEFVPAHVYVIHVESEHIILPGQYLVIPIHNPNRMEVLSPEDFQARYAPVSLERPYLQNLVPRVVGKPVEPTIKPIAAVDLPVPQPVEPPVLPDPVRVEVADAAVDLPAPAPPVAPPPASPRIVERIVERPAPFVVTQPAPQPKKTRGPTLNKTSTPTPGARIIWEGIPVAAQLGRIMCGIRQATVELDRREVSSSEASNYMPPADRRQISARISQAVSAGWIKLRKTASGFRFSVTPTGERTIEAVAYHSYVSVGLAVPPFLEKEMISGK